MGGKSVSHRATQHWQRKRMRYQKMKDYMEAASAKNWVPPSRDENVCPECGFKARYRFVRCPGCGSLVPEEMRGTEDGN